MASFAPGSLPNVILATLKKSSAPMHLGQIFDQCDEAPTPTHVAAALNELFKQRKVDRHGNPGKFAYAIGTGTETPTAGSESAEPLPTLASDSTAVPAKAAKPVRPKAAATAAPEHTVAEPATEPAAVERAAPPVAVVSIAKHTAANAKKAASVNALFKGKATAAAKPMPLPAACTCAQAERSALVDLELFARQAIVNAPSIELRVRLAASFIADWPMPLDDMPIELAKLFRKSLTQISGVA